MFLLRLALPLALLLASCACSSSSSSGGVLPGDASVSDVVSEGGAGGQPANDAAGEQDAAQDADVSLVSIENAVYWQEDPSKGNWPWIYGRLVNDSSMLLTSVDEIQAWFEGGTPLTFPSVNTYSDLFGQPGTYDPFTFWFFHVTSAGHQGDAGVSGSFNSSGGMSVNVADEPFEPYAVGTLHVVMKGKFVDGTTWQASVDYEPSP